MGTFDQQTVLVTGGTGSFGQEFARTLLERTDVRKVIVLSRDELKQYEMQRRFCDESRLRFFIGDVRDADRLHRAFGEVDIVVHAAALKHVPTAEYNPLEAVRTNINGAENVINAAIDCDVARVVMLSTDKACSPVNLYGATKLVSEKLFISGNAYVGPRRTRLSVVRYGNVVGSRGSVIPLFREQAARGSITLTDERMTRFWLTLPQAVDFVMRAIDEMQGCEIFVPRIPSMRMLDLARAIAPDAKVEIIGVRPGEKLHEELISVHDARRTLDLGSHYLIQPELEWWQPTPREGEPVPDGFHYSSDTNTLWLTPERLREIAGETA